MDTQLQPKDVIRANRLRLGLTEQQLADRSGVSRGSVQQWEKGSTAPKRKNQPAVAAALGITVAELMCLHNLTSRVKFSVADDERTDFMNAAGAVPLITWVLAASWPTFAEPYTEVGGAEWLPCPTEHGSRTFCLQVKGESMHNPIGEVSYRSGDIIFVDPDRTAQAGDRVVVRIDDQPEATFKELVSEDGRTMLKALNPEWKPRYIEVDEHATLVGVVIGRWTPE